MYHCELCDYKTDDRGNYSHHKRSKKHLDNSEKISIKEYEKLKKDYDELKQKNIELIAENKKLEEMNLFYKEQANKVINNTQNNTINIGTINYIKDKYPDAPPLEKLTNFIINGIDTNDVTQHDKFIDDIIYYNNNRILHEFLGDHIVKLYKKTDLTKQSLHTTDVSRLNYVIRVVNDSFDLLVTSDEENKNLLEDKDDDNLSESSENSEESKLENKKMWITDKKGYKICKLLIDPMVKQISYVLKRKIKQNRKTNIDNLDKQMRYHQSINNILESINTKKLKNEVNKYIAPKFNLDKI